MKQPGNFFAFVAAHWLDLLTLLLAALADPSISAVIPTHWAPALLALRAFMGIVVRMYAQFQASKPREGRKHKKAD